MAAQWFAVKARLLALFPTLPGWNGVVSVHNGAALDSVKRVFATVGHSDDGQTTRAGHFASELNDDGFRYIETGNVACSLVINDPSITLDAAETLVASLFNEIDAAIRADRTLGVLSQDGEAHLEVDVLSTQPIPGAAITVPFDIAYFTVT